MFFSQLAEEGVDIILELISLYFEHPAADGNILISCLFGIIFALGLVMLLLLIRCLFLLLPFRLLLLNLLMLHLEMGLISGLVGKELHALLTALEIGRILLLLGVAVIFRGFAHLIFKI